MALIKCWNCGHMVSDKGMKCPKCGTPIHYVVEQKDNPQLKTVNNEHQRKSKWGLLTGVIVLVLLLGAAAFYFLKNESKQIVLTPELTDAVQKYDEIRSFHDGLALVVKDGKYGYISENGEEVIPCQRKAFIFREGELDESILPDFSEGMAIFYTFTESESAYNGADDGSFRYGYINKDGEEVIPAQYKGASDFHEGLALVEDLNGKQMFINKSGEVMAEIDSKYRCVGGINDGLALVSQNSGYMSYGFIDKTGKVVIPLKYSNARPFSEGLAYVSNDSFEGFIDTKGNEAFSCKDYYDVGNYHEGLASVVKEEKNEDGYTAGWKLGFMDKNGKIVIPCTLPCHELEGGEPNADYEFFSDGIYEVSNENRFIDKAGKTVLDYDSRWWIPLNERFSEGLIVVAYGEQYGFMDKNGKVTISDAQIKKEEARRAEEEEKQRKYEEQLRQQEEQRRLAEQGPEWIQGTWIYSAYGMVSRVTISGRNITYDMDGNVQYSGSFEYRDGALHFGSNYIDVDEYSQRLKADDTHYFTRSGSGTSYSGSSSSSDNDEELRIMTRLKELQNKGKELTDELAMMRSRGQMDPMRYMYIKQNLIRYKDDQISLARKLGDSQMVYEYQQQKSKIEQALRMIENGM